MAFLSIALPVSITIAACVALLAFCDVAFRASRPAGVSHELNPWQPPMIRAAELFAWARNTASRLATDLLTRRRDAHAVAELAREIRSGAAHAMQQSPDGRRQEWTSDGKCFAMICLTPPEAIEIGEFIRRTQRAPDVQSIAGRASENSRRAERLDRADYRRAAIRCPLLSDNGRCMVQGVEPLQCRAGCPLGGDESLMAANHTATVPTVDTHAGSVALGIEQGMLEGIEATGLDGALCEFNGALAVVLNTPDAAEKWIHGDRIFEKCQPVE